MLRLFVLSALVLGSLFSVTATATALPPTDQICAKVWTQGTVVGYHPFGTCVAYNGPTLCAPLDAGLDPSAHVYELVCVPD